MSRAANRSMTKSGWKARDKAYREQQKERRRKNAERRQQKADREYRLIEDAAKATEE